MNPDRYTKRGLGKTPETIDSNYIAWVKSRPCIACGDGLVDAHHVKLRSHGRNDLTCIPLAHELHMELHSIGIKTFQLKYAIDLNEALVATLIDYIKEAR